MFLSSSSSSSTSEDEDHHAMEGDMAFAAVLGSGNSGFDHTYNYYPLFFPLLHTDVCTSIRDRSLEYKDCKLRMGNWLHAVICCMLHVACCISTCGCFCVYVCACTFRLNWDRIGGSWFGMQLAMRWRKLEMRTRRPAELYCTGN